MLRFLQLSLLLLALNLGLATAKPLEKRDFGPVTIFTPPSNYVNEKTLYARQLMLPDVSASYKSRGFTADSTSERWNPACNVGEL